MPRIIAAFAYRYEPDWMIEQLRQNLSWVDGFAEIGARSIILASCTHVGAGAVIGAGSVVTHDVPAGERWAGNPARPL